MPARTPEDCDRLFGEHVNAGQVEEVVAPYEEDGRFVQRDGNVAAGRPEIRKAIARLVAMRPVLRCDVVRVVKAGDGLAVVYNDWSLSAKGSDGERIGRARRKRCWPGRGRRAKIISVAVEKGFLTRSDSSAQDRRLRRAGLIERSLKTVLAVEDKL